MLMNIQQWMHALCEKLKHHFAQRLLFVGLQGSYRRGEATRNSDIDVVVTLTDVRLTDLNDYRQILLSMPEYEKACGFISGKEELQSWPKYELFQLLHDTRSYYGDLRTLLPEIENADIQNAVKIGASGLYHAACHSYLYGKDNWPESLKQLYKGTFFILQSVYYLKTGNYVDTKSVLLEKLTGEEQEILNISVNWPVEGRVENADLLFRRIIDWSGSLIRLT